MSGVVFVHYEGDPLPTGQALLRELGITHDRYTYIVGTAALEGYRADLAPEHQKEVDRDGRIAPQLDFYKALRRFLLTNHLLTRAEERVVLQRIAAEVAPNAATEGSLRSCSSSGKRYAWPRFRRSSHNSTMRSPFATITCTVGMRKP